MAIENGIERVGTRELWEQFDRNPLEVYQRVANEMDEAGIEDAPTMTRALEYAQPSENGDTLDTYERLLQEAGIRTKSDPVGGYWASPADDFLRTPGTRALLAEFYVRNWRKVSHSNDRATLLSNDSNVGSWERPYVDAMSPRFSERVAPAIALSELVAMTTPINSDAYRSLYMTYDATQLRMFRVGESADIPIADIVASERTIRLHKYGRGLRASYEVLRRMRVDKMAFYIQWAAIQAEIDKVAAALDVLINGDGNSGTTATVVDLNGDLDSASTPGTLTTKGWLAYRMRFEEPYVLTTALMRSDVALQLFLLNTGSANIPLVNMPAMVGGNQIIPINQTGDGVRVGWTSEAPALQIVGFDRRVALERVTEIGSEISETERFILNQTQVLTFTEVEGFAILDSNGVLIMDVND